MKIADRSPQDLIVNHGDDSIEVSNSKFLSCHVSLEDKAKTLSRFEEALILLVSI